MPGLALPYQEIHDLKDTQRNFEAIITFLASVFNKAAYLAAGTGTITWPGASPSSNGTTIILSGAKGHVQGLMLPQTAGLAFVVPRYVDNGDGTITFFAETWNSSNVASNVTTSFTYLIWGS